MDVVRRLAEGGGTGVAFGERNACGGFEDVVSVDRRVEVREIRDPVSDGGAFRGIATLLVRCLEVQEDECHTM